MNLLGIDYGQKRVGLALANDEAKIPRPLETLTNDHLLLERLRQIAAREVVGKVVVGLPRGLDGQHTEQTHLTEEFARRLEVNLELPVELVDEAATSEVAAARLGPNTSKESIDQEAAMIILEDYLHAS